jgi:oxygen-independent coproporphyrinogen-3 oxidase
MFDLVQNGIVKLPKEEKTLGMYNYAHKYLGTCGFDRYEVSNFTTSGYECQHNLHTWQMKEYIGLGAGAHGYIGGIRYNNVESIEEYISLINLSKKPIESDEKISKIEEFEETVMLGLRTKYGINLKDIKEKFNIDLYKKKNAEINYFLKENLIKISNDCLIVTDLGFPVLNKIILDLLS